MEELKRERGGRWGGRRRHEGGRGQVEKGGEEDEREDKVAGERRYKGGR